MLRLFGPGCAPAPIDAEATAALPEGAIWIDLLEPTKAEEQLAEALIGTNIPTRAEMLEIEPSSRLYERDGITVATASILHGVDEHCPDVDPVSFIVTDRHLVTLRYIDPPPFVSFAENAYADPKLIDSPMGTLIGLMEAIVDKLADRLEEVSAELDRISQQTFRHDKMETRRAPEIRYEVLMNRIGATQRVLAKVRESSVSATRMLSFLSSTDRIENHSVHARHAKSMIRDLNALSAHSDFVGDNVTFLLDAALGMIGLEQNKVMKIFSVVAVVLMPPTLIAGIYGMNFEHMPELRHVLGYPIALLAMLASAVLPYMWARRRGWL
jgi:magnesium transporter